MNVGTKPGNKGIEHPIDRDDHGQARIRPDERTVTSEFRATGGKAGGVFSGKPLILLHHIGAKSGT